MGTAELFEELLDVAGRVSPKTVAQALRRGNLVGLRISQLRRERGISQSDLGRRIGVTQRVMSYYENSATRVPAETLLRIADALKVSVYELLGRASSGRAPADRKLWKVLQKLESLPRRDQKAVMRYIDLLAQANGNGPG